MDCIEERTRDLAHNGLNQNPSSMFTFTVVENPLFAEELVGNLNSFSEAHIMSPDGMLKAVL